MALIINLSSTHEYSIEETVQAFVQICNQYSNGCLQSMPSFFQHFTNKAWVMAKYQANHASLIEPYKLGKITTREFLNNLAEIFNFLEDLDESERDKLLIHAWNASIKLSDKTEDRFSRIIEETKNQPVYLISNTNELNVVAILELLKQKNASVKFNQNIDVSIKDSKEPIEILPNIYLCLSYRYGAFKDETPTTMSLLEHLSSHLSGSKILVSQFSGDTRKGKELNFDEVIDADDFYNSKMIVSLDNI